jgi:hypothetical protein
MQSEYTEKIKNRYGDVPVSGSHLLLNDSNIHDKRARGEGMGMWDRHWLELKHTHLHMNTLR